MDQVWCRTPNKSCSSYYTEPSKRSQPAALRLPKARVVAILVRLLQFDAGTRMRRSVCKCCLHSHRKLCVGRHSKLGLVWAALLKAVVCAYNAYPSLEQLHATGCFCYTGVLKSRALVAKCLQFWNMGFLSLDEQYI